jgi:plasmid stabilization system protein ParE
MNTIFLPIAQQELAQTVEFYEQQLAGLGTSFHKEVFEAVDFISMFPEGYQLITKRTRKCLLRKFPYLVLYSNVNNTIIISAIAHQHRHPRSYLHR